MDGPRAIDRKDAPAVLVGFPYLRGFLKVRPSLRIRSWCLDSGAFSAWNSGTSIDLDAYIAVCKDLLATDPLLVEVIALDVIGDWRASLRNAEKMWQAGIPAIPAYHIGEPDDVLVGLARDYPKIGIGGMARLKGDRKRRFAEQCFARVWPKPVHGFGVGTRESLLAVPWHSVDATNWEVGPGKFGRWKALGGTNLGIRGSDHDLRVEVAHYLEVERLARHRWRHQFGGSGRSTGSQWYASIR
jgi:hypothetical protein